MMRMNDRISKRQPRMVRSLRIRKNGKLRAERIDLMPRQTARMIKMIRMMRAVWMAVRMSSERLSGISKGI